MKFAFFTLGCKVNLFETQALTQLAAERGLSARQTEVLDLLAHGYDVPSIAKKLFISENTTRGHAKSIYKKLDIHSRQELVDLDDQLTRA